MGERDFVFWLQGFMEIGNPVTLDEVQVQIIKDHLALVLKKETPDRHAPARDLAKGLEELQKKYPNIMPAVCSGPTQIVSTPNPHRTFLYEGPPVSY